MNKIKLQLKGRWCVHAIYKDVIHDPRLSIAGKGLYVTLMAFLSPGAECVYPSLDHLCRILASSRGRIQKHMRELRELGLLEVEQQRYLDSTKRWMYGPNLYSLKTRIKPVEKGKLPASDDQNDEKPQQITVAAFSGYRNTVARNTVARKPSYKVQTLGKDPHLERVPTTKTAFGGDADGGSNSPSAEKASPEETFEEAAHTFLHRTYVPLVGRVRGQGVPITAKTVQLLAQFFEDNSGWYPCDVAYVAFKGLLAAESWPKRPTGHDAWFYSRMVDVPQWFAPNKDGTSKIVHTAREIGYTPGRDQEEIESEIRKFLKDCA